MKRLLLAAIALTANIAVGATSITVYGYGADRESAKRDAFRTAIENVCGTAVLSDREHFNNNTVHDKIVSYSSCRIEQYEILEDHGNRVRLKVTLSDLRSSDRLFSKSNSRWQFDGDKMRAQLDSIKQEQRDGDEFIDSIFRDYPYRAYNLNKTKDPYVTIDSDRQIYLMVPYDIRWNYNFIKAMLNTFTMLETPQGKGLITVVAKNPDDLILGRTDKFFINDLHRLEYIKTKFTNQNEMRLNIKARDTRGKQVLNICYNPEYKAGGIFYSIGVDRKLVIFGNDNNAGTLRIKLTFPADVIYDIYVDVVAARDCKL